MKARYVIDDLGRHESTGRTTHYRGGAAIEPVCSLVIEEAADPGEFYLFYLDAEGRELTDTLHESVEQAMEQARFEFGVEFNEWAVDAESTGGVE